MADAEREALAPAGNKGRSLVGLRISAGLAGFLLLGLIDWAGREVTVVTNGTTDRLFLMGAGDYSEDIPDGFRVLRNTSEVILPGLPASRPVLLEAKLAANRPEHADITLNGSHIQTDIGGRVTQWKFDGMSDPAGVLRFRIQGPSMSGVRLYWARASALQRGLVPWNRLAWYILALAAFTLLDGWLGTAALGLVLPGGWATLVAGVLWERAFTAAYLPVALIGVGLAALMGWFLHKAFAMSRFLALGAAACLAFRIVLGLDPGFFEMDLAFHEHRLEAFQHGELISSGIQDPVSSGGAHLAIPYPPGLYAALTPFASRASAATVLRVAMVFFEVTSPLLVWWVMRRAGVSRLAADYGLAAAAVMPEGLLVLIKGIAANIFGQWITVVAIGLFALNGNPLLLAAVAAIAFLSHPGSAVCLGAYLVSWAALEVSEGARALRWGARLVGVLALGALIAWAVYYREVTGLTTGTLAHLGSSSMSVRPAAETFFRVRWLVVGKVFQNLILKFGGGLLPLAVYGLARGAIPRELRRIALAWLAVTALLFVAAVLTPVALRFEYFATPAIAMCAGIGSEAADRLDRHKLVVTCLWISAFVQVVIGCFHLSGLFEPWAVIIPAHWPFPFRWPSGGP
jgi:hypothetical protein